MIDYINLGLIVLALGLAVMGEIRERSWRAERSQLLNRIMARTLPEFTQAEADLKPLKVVSLDELKREIAPHPREEEGIEV